MSVVERPGRIGLCWLEVARMLYQGYIQASGTCSPTASRFRVQTSWSSGLPHLKARCFQSLGDAFPVPDSQAKYFYTTLAVCAGSRRLQHQRPCTAGGQVMQPIRSLWLYLLLRHCQACGVYCEARVTLQLSVGSTGI